MHIATLALMVVRRIEKGDVTLSLLTERRQPGDSGWVDYQDSNGWRFRVFYDAGDWDYIDAVAKANGEWVEVEPEPQTPWYRLLMWSPTDETPWVRAK